MTSDEIIEAARLYRRIADLMDEVVDLRAKYRAMCEDAGDAIAKQRAAEQALERERAAVVRMDKEIGDWTWICDQRDAASNRADAAEDRVAELEAAAEGAILTAIPGVLGKVAERIERDRGEWVCSHSGQVDPNVVDGFLLGVQHARAAVEFLHKYPKYALPEGSP